jgi:hypothetical protein
VLSEMDDAFLASLLNFAHDAIVAFTAADAEFETLEPTVNGPDAVKIRAVRVAMQQAAQPLLGLSCEFAREELKARLAAYFGS